MAENYELMGGVDPRTGVVTPGETEDTLPSSVTQYVVGPDQVKTLDSGLDRQGVKNLLRSELDSTMSKNHDLLHDLFSLIGDIFKGIFTAGGTLLEGVVSGVKSFIDDLASAMMGENTAHMQVVANAMQTQMESVAQTAISQSAQDIQEISNRVDVLANEQTTLSTAQGEISNQLSANTTQLGTLNHKYEGIVNETLPTLTTTFDDKLAAQKQVIAEDLTETTGTATDALTKAEKGISWLENGGEIGSSLIAYETGTTSPVWAKNFTTEAITGHPAGLTSTFRWPNITGNPIALPKPVPEKWVKADPRLTYEVAIWVRTPTTTAVSGAFTFVDQNGNNPFKSTAALQTGISKTTDAAGITTATPVMWSPSITAGTTGTVEVTGVTQTWKKYRGVIELNDGVERVRIATATAGTGAVGNLMVCGFEIVPLIPKQADIDRAQNDAIAANTTAITLQNEINRKQVDWNNATTQVLDTQSNINKATAWALANQAEINQTVLDNQAMQTEWNDTQTGWNARQQEINTLVQTQIWAHQDTIELLDIRAPKSEMFVNSEYASQFAGTAPYTVNYYPSWAIQPGSGSGGSSSSGSSSTDYNNQWFQNDWLLLVIYPKLDTFMIQAKAPWVGTVSLDVNWSNGAIDIYQATITTTNRTFTFKAGAIGIGIRAIRATVACKSLMRAVTLTGASAGSTYPTSYTQNKSLVRSVGEDTTVRTGGWARFTNVVTANATVNSWDLFNGAQISWAAGDRIPAYKLHIPQGSTVTFKEVADPPTGTSPATL